jgi:hypothetical protein
MCRSRRPFHLTRYRALIREPVLTVHETVSPSCIAFPNVYHDWRISSDRAESLLRHYLARSVRALTLILEERNYFRGVRL